MGIEGGEDVRLGDLDALKDNLFHYAAPEMVWDRWDIEHKINEMPIIDAIPVEWLEEHDGVDIRDSDGNIYARRRMTVVEALSMWQKEREAQD